MKSRRSDVKTRKSFMMSHLSFNSQNYLICNVHLVAASHVSLFDTIRSVTRPLPADAPANLQKLARLTRKLVPLQSPPCRQMSPSVCLSVCQRRSADDLERVDCAAAGICASYLRVLRLADTADPAVRTLRLRRAFG